ncbi:uncharacterized protein BDCG_01954 [Blastomyces dermatitidis ER-3]|uniref:Bacteriophage T5 Orf172 DNA-binding domain-containing protein n=1 Tax=Ajellomyces dermatitidis (strain ER-3 / ATCC MYA-2586) TaxID=559297 RepID=A0ABP2ESR6_AJEDR|nr:uncharacterized protein BDCG_01954 [Blastomyces dermatitidis ER-3]EEQ86834.2 hypothetical protein BDCG_01954 [Blastomyces dermatitidis ER-3]
MLLNMVGTAQPLNGCPLVDVTFFPVQHQVRCLVTGEGIHETNTRAADDWAWTPTRLDAQEDKMYQYSPPATENLIFSFRSTGWTILSSKVHATVSEQELLLVENFLQLRESRINERARNLKRTRLSEQEFSTPESQELIKRDSPILESDCIDTNFRKKGWDFKSQSSSSSKTNSSAGSPLAMPVPVPKTLSNVKATSEWALRRTSYKGGNRRSLKRQKGNIQEGDARLEPLKTVPSCDILQWIETLIGSSLRTTHKKMAIKELNENSAVNTGSVSGTRKPKAMTGPPTAISRPIPQLQNFTPYRPKCQEEHLKIGMTKDISKRLQRWEKQCGTKLEVYFPNKMQQMNRGSRTYYPSKHIFRVEGLVHAELKEQRKREGNCADCGEAHREWFECATKTPSALALPAKHSLPNHDHDRPHGKISDKGRLIDNLTTTKIHNLAGNCCRFQTTQMPHHTFNSQSSAPK